MGEAKSAPVERAPEKPQSPPPPRAEQRAEAEIAEVMRTNAWSRAEAIKYIEEGGLDMEQYQREVNAPLDEAIAKIKDNGPPQWFLDMMSQKAAEEGGSGLAAAGVEPVNAPSMLGPPP